MWKAFIYYDAMVLCNSELRSRRCITLVGGPSISGGGCGGDNISV